MELEQQPSKTTYPPPPHPQKREDGSFTQPLESSGSGSRTIGGDEATSTHQQVTLDTPFRVGQTYRVDGGLLRDTGVTENMRARMRAYLMGECAKQYIMRETCVLACHYLDLYLARGGRLEPGRLEGLPIGCLMLALKICEGRFPQDLFRNFSLVDIRATELTLTLNFNFKLNPPTYYTFAERLVFLWHEWKSRDPYPSLLTTQEGPSLAMRAFYEQLDLTFLVVRSLYFDFEEIVATLFYLRVAIMHGSVPRDCHKMPVQEFQEIFSRQDSLRNTFSSFLRSSFDQVRISLDAALLVRNFMGVEPKLSPWRLNSNQTIEKIRKWDRFQTCPKGSYVLAKQVSGRLGKEGQMRAE